MIVSADSSSIVSIHLQEVDRHEVARGVFDAAEVVACSIVAYVEVRAALARARRLPVQAPRLDKAAYDEVAQAFDRDWRLYARMSVTDVLAHLAGDLAEKHDIKGYDAIHLASAITLNGDAADEVFVSTWDERLAEAAQAEGLRLGHAAAS